MTTRITESQLTRTLISSITTNRNLVNQFSEEVSTGYKVQTPGDSTSSGTIAQLRTTLDNVDAYKDRVSNVEGYLAFKDSVMTEVYELMIRTKEIVAQGANESLSDEEREKLAPEIFQLRDQLLSLANSTYKGRYVFAGAADNTPPYISDTDYTNSSTDFPESALKYVFTSAVGTSLTRSVQISESTSITLNDTPGNQIFDNALQALERAGRALVGYATDPAPDFSTDPPTLTLPDGSGVAYSGTTALQDQTADLQEVMRLIDYAVNSDVMPERVAIGGKQGRLQSAKSLLELSENSAKEVLDRLQNADYTESISSLSQAQTALQASYSVTSQILGQTIMNYL